MSLTKLQELEDEMKKCFRCSLCKMVPLPVMSNPKYSDCCPANREFHFHGYSGSGKNIMALSLIEGRIKADETLAKITFACTACGYCDVACKFIMDAERHEVNMALREHLVDEGQGLEVHKKIVDLMVLGKAGGNEKIKPFADSVSGLKLMPRQKAKVLLFGGCLSGDNNSFRVTEKLARLLVHAGIDVGVLENEPNSGLFAYWTGHRDAFIKMSKKTVKAFNEAGPTTIVAVSGADLGMFRAKYPEYAKAPAAKVVHATELLEKLIKNGKIKLKKPVHKKVTYHDPCYLGRQSEPPVKWEGETKMTHGCMTYTDPPKPVNRGGNGVFDAPRNILKAIDGLEFVEMFRIREYSFCCGGGGGVPKAYPQLAKSTAKHRIEEARDVGAQYIVTVCHNCVRNLSANSDSGKGDQMPVINIIDLVYEAADI